MKHGIRVLLVDDEIIFAEGLIKVLTRRGMSVQSAPDGRKALELISGQSFDVIVLDLRMPGMGGLATLRAIRQQGSRTPVLLLTGYLDSNDVAEAMKEGVREVLFKPCPVRNLVSSIESACNHESFVH